MGFDFLFRRVLSCCCCYYYCVSVVKLKLIYLKWIGSKEENQGNETIINEITHKLCIYARSRNFEDHFQWKRKYYYSTKVEINFELSSCIRNKNIQLKSRMKTSRIINRNINSAQQLETHTHH